VSVTAFYQFARGGSGFSGSGGYASSPRSVTCRYLGLALVVALLAIARPQAANCIESIELIPKQAAMMHPLTRYTFTVRVRVNQHADHRGLVLAYGGGPVTSSSYRQIDGEDVPKTWTFQVRDLPGGKYTFVATVLGADSKPLATDRFTTTLIGDDDGDR
jgi:hypothetical protein